MAQPPTDSLTARFILFLRGIRETAHSMGLPSENDSIPFTLYDSLRWRHQVRQNPSEYDDSVISHPWIQLPWPRTHRTMDRATYMILLHSSPRAPEMIAFLFTAYRAYGYHLGQQDYLNGESRIIQVDENSLLDAHQRNPHYDHSY